MVFETIDSSEIAAGKPLTASLLQRIVNNINDVDARAEGLETATVTTNNTIPVRTAILLQFGDTTGGSITTTLPAASQMLNRTLIFKKISSDSNTFTIDGAGSDTIEGQLNQVLTTQNQTLYIISNGTSWYKVADIDASGQVPQSRAINVSAPLTGGGNFTTDRTIALPLANGELFIGNASNVPVARPITGDIAITNTGVTSIAAGAIVNNQISPTAAIDLSKININSNLVSDGNNTRDLGSDAAEFKDLWTHSIKHGDASNANLTISTTSNNGNISLSTHGTGTVSTNSKLTVPSIQITAGAAAGYILESDASGNATWVAPAAGTFLAGLNDVSLTSPAPLQVLTYNGTDWVNSFIQTDSLNNFAVTEAKIANLTITNDKIANATIGLEKLAPLATTNRILITSATGAISAHGVQSANRLLRTDANGLPVSLTQITSNRALISDASGYPTASSVTPTELGYLSGVTSSIQTQLNTIVSTISVDNPYSGSYVGSDSASGVAIGLTIPSGDLNMFFMDIVVNLSDGTRSRVSRRYYVAKDSTATGRVLSLAETIHSSGSPSNATNVTLALFGTSSIVYSCPTFTNSVSVTFKWRGFRYLN